MDAEADTVVLKEAEPLALREGCDAVALPEAAAEAEGRDADADAEEVVEPE